MFNAQQYDQNKVNNGAWRDIMGGQFLIARAGNERYLEAQERNGRRKATNAADRQRALYQSIAEGILLDWRDVVDKDGNTIAYSVPAAVEVLNDNPDLVSAILAEANDSEAFRREDIAEQKKKPQKGSATG